MSITYSNYQKDIFSFISNQKGSAIVEAVAGCLAGDSIINFNRASKGFSSTIEDAFNRFNNTAAKAGRNWDQSIPTFVRSYNGTNIKLHEIQNIVQSGIKLVYRLELDNGKYIDATSDHKIMTENGYIPLLNLTINHSIMCDTLHANSTEEATKRRDPMVRGIKYHPYAYKDGKYKRLELHRVIYEAALNNLDVEEYVNQLKTSKESLKLYSFIDSTKFDIHHKDFDHTNNDISNLTAMKKSEHRKLHIKDNYNNFNQGIPVFSNVKSITKLKEVMTYDIVCHDPYRNFVANGIVVHNSGKTFTIVESLKRINMGKRILFCAFNKSIALELTDRVPSHVQVKTLNGLGHGAWMRYSEQMVKLNTFKNRQMIENNPLIKVRYPKHQYRNIYTKATHLMRYAKTMGVVPAEMEGLTGLMPDTPETWEHLVQHFNVDFTKEKNISAEEAKSIAIEIAQIALIDSLNNWSEIDFDDQLYMTVVYSAEMGKYDYVFVDEAQDVSAIQLEMISRSVNPSGGRIIAVGDPHQAIYGFRGADSKALQNIGNRFSATRLPLSTSYRCAQLVVKEAQKVVSHILAHEEAPIGTVTTTEINKDIIRNMKEKDMIICRNNAPLIQTAFKIMYEQKKCTVLGRDIGKNLSSIVKKLKVSEIQQVKEELEQWLKDETQLALKISEDADISIIEDKYLCIKFFIDMSGAKNALELIQAIEKMFGDKDDPGILLCSIHKAKGLEADTVYFLDSRLIPSKYSKLPWQIEQEENLRYVAITRAKNNLVYLNSPKKEPSFN